MYCINCGEKNREDAKFCSRCGKEIQEVANNTPVMEVGQSEQPVATVQEQIKKGKSNKNLLWTIGALLVIVGGFFAVKPLFNQKKSASGVLYTGIESLVSAHAFDFEAKIVSGEGVNLKGDLEFGDSLSESKANIKVSSEGEENKVKIEDGMISDDYGNESELSEVFFSTPINGIRWDDLIKDGSLDKEWIFNQVDIVTGIVPSSVIPFRIPKSQTIDILLRDFFLNYAQDTKIEEKLFIHNKKEGSNHYSLSINIWDFVEVFSDYLNVVEDDNKKIERLGLKSREVEGAATAVDWLKTVANEEGLREALVREDVDIEIKLNKKNQLENLSVSTSKDIGVKFDIKLANYKEANRKRK